MNYGKDVVCWDQNVKNITLIWRPAESKIIVPNVFFKITNVNRVSRFTLPFRGRALFKKVFVKTFIYISSKSDVRNYNFKDIAQFSCLSILGSCPRTESDQNIILLF